jgi:superfamily II DNA or RNA helicase
MATTNQGFGKDRRRRLSKQEAGELFARAGGACQQCGVPLGIDWHQAHLVAYTNGGATSLDQMRAWCRTCNLAQGAVDALNSEMPEPREWQRQALDVVIERIWQAGTATVHAAPGAGKTLFAGMTFRRLAAAGLVKRLVVVVPNRALQRQWAESLAKLKVHLDWEPRDGFLELPNTVGTVVTYHGLANSAAGQVAQMGEPTLLVLDEVHHVGDQKAWGLAVSRIVGSVDTDVGVHPAGVLNMTGTLFRSSGNQRIGTVRYDEIVEGGVAKYQAVADFSVPASSLIGIELRRPDLYAYDGKVELVDVRDETLIAGDIADLEVGSQVNTAIRQGFMQRPLVHAFAREALKLLSQQLATVENRAPLKLLWVAENQQAARLAAEEIDKAAGRPFARLVISDDKDALKTLREAARSDQSCAIVAVRMVTEGFDCPEVSVIAYASATTAVLFLAQTMARAMRVTPVERTDRRMLPAQILIPNNPALRSAFAEALVGHFHILEIPSELGPEADSSSSGDAGLRLPRYSLADMSTLDLHSATVLGESDGTVMADELEASLRLCLELDIPEVYAPRVAVASRRLGPRLPLYTQTARPGATVGVTERPADPRSVNKARRTRITSVASWMSRHVEHDERYTTIGVFQGQANSAAGLKPGERESAGSDALQVVEAWMLARVREHCSSHGCATPAVARDPDT